MRYNFTSNQPETRITSKLVDILEEMRYGWTIEVEANPFTVGSKKLDAFVTEHGREPIAIEAKYADTHTEEKLQEQAVSRLVRELVPDRAYDSVTNTLNNVMAIRYPVRFKTEAGRDLRQVLLDADDLQYKLFGNTGQFPANGWAKGKVTDIANALHIGATPNSQLEAEADKMELSINKAANLIEDAIAERPGIGNSIEKILRQTRGEQTSRMAALIITDAFVFQSSLAGSTQMKNVYSLGQLLRNMNSADVITDWNAILKVNYHPIFEDARDLVEALDTADDLVKPILTLLCQAAKELVDTGLAQMHELTGMVFQKLIIDRKYLKANYTLPESAALLSALVLPELPDGKLPKVVDFACGTGALLNGVYQRVLALHEQAGGNGRDVHKQMLEKHIGGADVMPNATHLTFAALASTYSDIKLGGTRVLTAPYGLLDNGYYAVGSLELLNDQPPLPTLDEARAERLGGEKGEVVDFQNAFPHGEWHIVIQNPPFTKPNADANASDNKGLFRGHDRPEDDAEAMRLAVASKDRRVSKSAGMAGLGAYFVDLADKKLKRGGTMGFILPATILAGTSMQKVRDVWATEYHNVTVITIAQADASNCAFSADTNMAECMVIATKGIGANTGRGKFACLNHRPESPLEALEIANRVNRSPSIRRMEDAPSSGDTLKIGEDVVGQVLECPLKVGEGWSATRTKAMELIQIGHHLINGKLNLAAELKVVDIPMCRVADLATVSMSHLHVYGAGEQGTFDMAKGYTDRDDYPCLWQVNSPVQRTMEALPDFHGVLRPGREAKLQQLLARNSRAHYNVNLRFNASSAAAVFTEKPSIGVRSLSNVAFNDLRYEYPFMLWSNSTFGLLCHWMHAGKQQPGRGMMALKTLGTLPTLDVTALTEAQLIEAEAIFNALKHKKLLPFNECAHDPKRHELDRRVLELLRITDPAIYDTMKTLRRKLSREPSIQGTKKSQCNLKAELALLKRKGLPFPSWYE